MLHGTPKLGNGTTRQPSSGCCAEAAEATAFSEFTEGFGAQTPWVHLLGGRLWREEKRPFFSGCDLIPDCDAIFSVVRALAIGWLVLGTARNPCALGCCAAMEVRGEAAKALRTAGDGGETWLTIEMAGDGGGAECCEKTVRGVRKTVAAAANPKRRIKDLLRGLYTLSQ